MAAGPLTGSIGLMKRKFGSLASALTSAIKSGTSGAVGTRIAGLDPATAEADRRGVLISTDIEPNETALMRGFDRQLALSHGCRVGQDCLLFLRRHALFDQWCDRHAEDGREQLAIDLRDQ